MNILRQNYNVLKISLGIKSYLLIYSVPETNSAFNLATLEFTELMNNSSSGPWCEAVSVLTSPGKATMKEGG